jgi:hypothetical protein
VQSQAKTVLEYLASLPPDRRAALEEVRRVVLANIDAEIEEGMQYGHIGYYVPHRVFPEGYHCDPTQPLPYLALASQKQHMAAYLMFAYMGGASSEAWIREAYAKAGRRIDMGKSCLRFRSLKDIDLDILGEAIRRAPTRAYVERYVEMVGPGAWRRRAAKRAAIPPAGAGARSAVNEPPKKSVKKSVKKAVRKAVKKSAQKTVKKRAKKSAKPSPRTLSRQR